VAVIILKKFVVVEVSCELCCVDTISRDIVLKVLNVFACSVPPIFTGPKRIATLIGFSTHFLESFLAKNYWFHSSLIQTVSFCKV